MWRFGVFFDLRLNKRLVKQPRRWWFETPWRSGWRHCNDVYPIRSRYLKYLCHSMAITKRVSRFCSVLISILWHIQPFYKPSNTFTGTHCLFCICLVDVNSHRWEASVQQFCVAKKPRQFADSCWGPRQAVMNNANKSDEIIPVGYI